MRLLVGLLVLLGCAARVAAGFVVVANFTAAEVAFAVTEPGGKPQEVKVPPARLLPVRIAGPADLTYAAKAGNTAVRVDPYNAYVFVPDPKTGLALHGLELPGEPPAADLKPEANPAPRTPVTVRVTLLVDDADPRAERVWQPAVRKRFDAAAAVIAAHAPVKLEFAGFATWKSDPTSADVAAVAADFEEQVKVKPGELAVGFASRRVEGGEKDAGPFGACKGVLAPHVLVREPRPNTEVEKVEVLVQQLGIALGAVPSEDRTSVMRPALGDGLARHPRFVIRFDPLNALAMNLWADELRQGPVPEMSGVSPVSKVRLARVYGALLKVRPADSFAHAYLNELDPALARAADPPKAPDPPAPPPVKAARPVAAAPKKDAPPTPPVNPRDAAIRRVLRAVMVRAQANAGPTPLTGDELTAAYIRTAAVEALAVGEGHRTVAFLVGLGVALDDTSQLLNLLEFGAVGRLETDAERADRLAVLGNPTVRHRRDLCRRFAAGLVSGAIRSPSEADDAAFTRFFADRDRPTGLSFPALAADLAGIAFAQKLRPDTLARLRETATPADFLPPLHGLRDAVTAERLTTDFGGVQDRRFEAVVNEVRQRVQKLPGR